MASLELRVKRLEELRRQLYREPFIITREGHPTTCLQGQGKQLLRKPGETETLFLNRAKKWAIENRLLVLDAVFSDEGMEVADHADA